MKSDTVPLLIQRDTSLGSVLVWTVFKNRDLLKHLTLKVCDKRLVKFILIKNIKTDDVSTLATQHYQVEI